VSVDDPGADQYVEDHEGQEGEGPEKDGLG
jgi:hypothetical protein